MMTPVDLNLPFPRWNPEQWETIAKLAASDKPITLLEAPTGAGKSGIITGLANLLDLDVMVLTETKQLQDQYKQSLDYFTVMGRNNFPCLLLPVTADAGICTLGGECPHKTITRHYYIPPEVHDDCEPCDNSPGDGSDMCPYYDQRYRGETEQYTSLNYAYWLTLANYTNSFTHRGLTVFDEAHSLESQLRSFATVGFSRRTMDILDLSACWADPEDVFAWQTWANDNRQKLAREYFKIQKNQAGPVSSPHDEARRKAIMSFCRAADLFMKLGPQDWAGETNPRTGYTEFKPVWVGPLAHQFVYRHLGERTIMMSGTILDKEIFCRNIGLDVSQVDFIQMPSTFDVSRRPFYYAPLEKGSYRDKEYVTRAVEHIDEILDRHTEENGIIHTVSHALAQQIITQSRHSKRMITHDTLTKQAALNLFRHKGGIWISPSSHTGVDLPYDLCRFQILAKIPFPNKGDKQIKKLMQEDETTGKASKLANDWYMWATTCALIQAYGRGMRAPDDRCTTYLIDPNWRWFRAAVRRLLPSWFREAVRNLLPQPVGTAARPAGNTLGDVQNLLKSLGIGK